MNRLTSGMVPFLALLLAVGCSGDATDPLRGGATRIDAAPSQLFLQLGETKTVDVSAVDDQGNQISSAYEVTATGSGITVRRDSTFLPIFINDSTLSVPAEAPVFRFVVTATGYGATSFTVSADGKDVTVPVQVVAQSVIEAAISNLNPALNEEVTITAPPGTSFSPTSQVTLADAAAVQPFTVSVAPDGSSIVFLAAPNITDQQLLLTDVVSAASPTLLFSPFTADRLTSPALKEFDGTLSSLTPPANQPVTVTLNNATFDPATSTFLVGAAPAILIGATATTATIIPAPGSSGLLLFNGVVIDSIPQFTLSLSNAETDTITVGPVGSAAGTDDPSTAPSLAVPDPGFAAPFFDAADFDAATDHFYKLDIPVDGDYTITLDWTSGSDIDMFVCPDPGAITGACDFQAATGSQPEEGVFTLTAGTYYVIADDYAGDAGLSTLTVTVAR
jgi:Bacterial pre-peptidase C-terminal domain